MPTSKRRLDDSTTCVESLVVGFAPTGSLVGAIFAPASGHSWSPMGRVEETPLIDEGADKGDRGGVHAVGPRQNAWM